MIRSQTLAGSCGSVPWPVSGTQALGPPVPGGRMHNGARCLQLGCGLPERLRD